MVVDITRLRKDTECIIDCNPSLISFIRRERVKNEYGNVAEAEKKTEAQRVRIAEIAHSETDRLLQEGLLKTHIVNITAFHDADIQAGDLFDFQGSRYEVVFIRKITIGGYAPENAYKMSGRAKEIREAVE
nr:MAG TPA: head-tail joining protein [Caudoviricetes sp.]